MRSAMAVRNFFRQHAAAPRTIPFHQRGALFGRSEFEIDFDDVGDFGQRLARIITDVVVERDQVSGFVQVMAGGQHFGISGNGFQNLDHD